MLFRVCVLPLERHIEELRAFTPGDTEAMSKPEVKAFDMKFAVEMFLNLGKIIKG